MKFRNFFLVASLVLCAFVFYFYRVLPALAAESKKAEAKETGFVGSKESKKFHRSACEVTKYIPFKDRVTFKKMEDAEKAGYKPCDICRPTDFAYRHKYDDPPQEKQKHVK